MSQVRTEYGVLPVDHPKRMEALLDSAVEMLQGGNSAGCADSVLRPTMEQTDQVGLDALQLLALLMHDSDISAVSACM